MMNLFEELKDTAVKKSEAGDFPDWLLAEVLEVAGSPGLYGDQHGVVEMLLAQVHDYDTYAGAGCFDSSVTADMITRTLRLLRRL